jgi:hypothetical protein
MINLVSYPPTELYVRIFINIPVNGARKIFLLVSASLSWCVISPEAIRKSK